MSTVQEAETAVTVAAEVTPAAPEVLHHRFTAEAFRKMIEADVFADGDRVELWDGWIVDKMAKKVPHASSSMMVSFTLNRCLPDGWFLTGENPINLGPEQTPLPDHFVLKGNPRDYAGRYPEPPEVGLIIELADSSLRNDTTTKLAGYAGANIPTYWVINLVANVVQAYEAPVPAERRYAVARTYAAGQSVPLRLDGVLVAEVPALDLLPASA